MTSVRDLEDVQGVPVTSQLLFFSLSEVFPLKVPSEYVSASNVLLSRHTSTFSSALFPYNFPYNVLRALHEGQDEIKTGQDAEEMYLGNLFSL